jgi:hypothetical protein
MGERDIRRCECNAKTHGSKWRYGQMCPVCGQAGSYRSTNHGALRPNEIDELRAGQGLPPLYSGTRREQESD